MSTASDLEGSGFEDTLGLGSKASSEAAPEPDTGRRIGPYRLLQVIGEGGMGEVWVAEQLEPRRKVALKLIKAGMDTKQVVARFESERQALALMDHPAIAKVFDGGSTPEGRPYFVMEYVAGVPITEHCDTHKLSTSARLELFAEVCEGVQHAHQKAIIHRDLKPSNILVSLVDGKAQPKIIDFGIAKATGYRLTEKTLFTELGAIIGTPEYMSPEQADLTGQDVDTRTDVYALGVLLYQLLTGELPFTSKELRSSSYEELRRKLREVEPPRPSTKLTTLGDGAAHAATKRDTNPGALRQQLRGDLDAITMKALEKERDRRYSTPSEFAQDIARHLRNEPVVARPASTAYRLRKYVQRHRLGVGLATGLAALLVAFALAMGIQARRIAVERDSAIREKQSTEKAARFLGNMLSGVKPQALGAAIWKDQRERVEKARRAKGASDEELAAALLSLDGALAGVNPTQTAQHVLDDQILEPAGLAVEQQMGSEPKVAGWLEHQLGRTYRALGLFKQAEQHLKRAIEIQSAGIGPQDTSTISSTVDLAATYQTEGRYPEAEKRLLETLELIRKHGVESTPGGQYGLQRWSATQILAGVYVQEGRYPEAEKLMQENLESRRHLDGPSAETSLSAAGDLAALYYRTGRAAEAEALLRPTLDQERKALGPDHPETLRVTQLLSLALMAQSHYVDAETTGRELLEAQRRVLGPEHKDTLATMNNLANISESLGHFKEAEALLHEAVDGMRRVVGPEAPATLATMNTLGNVYADEGRYPDAAKLLAQTLEAQRRTLGPEHPYALESAFALADVYDSEGRYAEAEKLAQGVVTTYERTKFQDAESVAAARVALGRALGGLKRYPQAEQQLLDAEHLLASTKGLPRKKCLHALVALYDSWEKAEPEAGRAASAATWKAALAGTE
jgi:eukaryotic-like serine/threonine-protein kinase